MSLDDWNGRLVDGNHRLAVYIATRPEVHCRRPKNTYVYVANSTANVITGYTLGTGGTLTPLSTSPFTTGSAPNAMSLDSTGSTYLCDSGGSPDLQVFSFDATNGGQLDTVDFCRDWN